MELFRRHWMFALSVAVILIGSCATSSKRFSEDLQKDGFTVQIIDDHATSASPIVNITDAESVDRLVQWFRHRPHRSADLGTQLLNQALAQSMRDQRNQYLRIETNHFRVDFPFFPHLISLEMLSTADDAEKMTYWKVRKDDIELHQWAMSLIQKECQDHIEQGRSDTSNPEESEKLLNTVRDE